MIKKIPLAQIKPNPSNPRTIRDNKFKKLVQSLLSFPDMARVRPIVVNKDMVILGGNMRYKAMQEAGWSECHVEVVDWPEDKQKEFIIKDNVGFGEWDWDELTSDWNAVDLEAWGLDVPNEGKDNDNDSYSTKVESPIYEIKGEKPKPEDIYDLGKYGELMSKIKNADISDKDKILLQLAATRHIVFDYSKAAEYYAHSESEIQELMEDSALVIIDYDKAIELGFAKLYDDLSRLAEIDA